MPAIYLTQYYYSFVGYVYNRATPSRLRLEYLSIQTHYSEYSLLSINIIGYMILDVVPI